MLKLVRNLGYNQPYNLYKNTLYIKRGNNPEKPIPITVSVSGVNFEPISKTFYLDIYTDARDYAKEAKDKAESELLNAARVVQNAQKKYADTVKEEFDKEIDKAAKNDEKKKKEVKANSVAKLKKAMGQNGMFTPWHGMPTKAVDACYEAIIDMFINHSGVEKKLSEIKKTLDSTEFALEIVNTVAKNIKKIDINTVLK